MTKTEKHLGVLTILNTNIVSIITGTYEEREEAQLKFADEIVSYFEKQSFKEKVTKKWEELGLISPLEIYGKKIDTIIK